MTKQEIKEKIIEKLAMTITHSKEGEYAKNESFVREIISSALDTAYEDGRKQERERIKDIVKKEMCSDYDGDCEGCVFGEIILKEITLAELEKENE